MQPNRSKLGGPGTGVGGQLRRGSFNHATANRLGATRRNQRGEGSLDEPVFKRMERDNGHSRPGIEPTSRTVEARQQGVETSEFIVDGDPKGLKGLGGRVDLTGSASG